MRILLSLTLIMLLASPVLACRVADVSDEERFEGAEAVFHGLVTGVRIPVMEARPPALGQKTTRPFSIGRRNYELRVVVGKTLKGEPEDLLVFEVHWCGGGYAELGDEVTVYRYGESRWYVQSHALR